MMLNLLKSTSLSENKQGTLPDFIIIGAMKSGTTSLHYYLNCHPEIYMSREKELRFFVESNNWTKGIEWYKSQFIGNAKISGEASPAYTKYPIFRGVPERMHSVIPHAKLIYVVRDPIERIISHYVHRYASGTEDRTLAEALMNFKNESYNFYVSRSQYYLQIEQYLQYYSPNNILVISSEELSNIPQKTLQTIFKFLEVSDNPEFIKCQKKIHTSIKKRRKTKLGNQITSLPIMSIIDHLPSSWKYHLNKLIYFPFSTPIKKPQLSKDLRIRLIDYLQEDINQLRTFTGKDFNEWCL
ncbi:MAG: sulfotransferase domain-containing protein [Microcystis aeruginosa L111-01]|jgi:hypothetical protein|nr:sulfotransferase domain-containing protein [Microcystis aeruginosa L111-01]